MIRFDESQLPSLGNYDEATMREVMRHMRILDGSFREVDETKLRMAFRQIFLEWYEKEKQKRANDAARQAQEEAERQAANEKATIAAADSRWKEYVKVGLLDTEYNKALLRDYMVQNQMTYSANALSLAINTLEGQLHWAIWSKRHNQPPEEEPQAEEVLGRVKGTNEKQLPLNATEKDLRAASPAQVKDWMARKRAADNQEYVLSQHSHGVAF